MTNADQIVFSYSWYGLANGTEVTYQGGTYTIGEDAFANYASAKAAGANVVICDKFYDPAWADAQSGDVVSIVLDGETASLTIGTEAFTTQSAARKAAGTSVGVVENGTSYYWSRGGHRTDVASAAGQFVVLSHVTDTTTVSNSGLGLLKDNVTVLITNGSFLDHFDYYGFDTSNLTRTIIVSGGTAKILAASSTSSADTYTVDPTTGKFIWSGAAKHSTTNFVVDSTATVNLIINGNQGGAATGDFFTTLNQAYVGKIYAEGENNGGATYGNVFVNLNSGTVGTISCHTALTGSHYLEINALSGASYITTYSLDSAKMSGIAITVNAKDRASLQIGSSISASSVSAKNITIDVDNFEFGQAETSFTVLSATGGVSEYQIHVTGTAKSKIDVVATSNSIKIEEASSFFSAGWADLAQGTVVKTPSGTATIGTNAFATYDEAYAYSKKVVCCDTYYDSAWKGLAVGSAVTVVIPGGSFSATIDNTTFCNTLSAAQSALKDYSGNAVVWMGGTMTGNRTTQTSLLGKKSVLYDCISAKFGSVDLGAVVVCDTSGQGTIKTGDATLGDGCKLAVVYGNRNGSTAKDIVFSVTVEKNAYVEYLATNFNGTVGSSDTYTIDPVTGKLVWNNDTGTSHSEMTAYVQGGTAKSISPTVYSGNYTGDVVVHVTDGGYVTSVIGRSVGTAIGNTYIDLAGGTIGTISGVASGAANRYFEVTVSGNTTSRINTFSYMTSLSGYSITVKANEGATLALGSNAAVSITIDNTDFAFSGETKSFTVISGDVALSSLQYTLTDTTHEGYVVFEDGKTISFLKNPIAISGLYASYADGEIVTTALGSGTVGVNAFASKAAAVAAGADGYLMPIDVFYNNAWKTGEVVVIEGSTYTVGDGKAFNNFSSAVTQQLANGYGAVNFQGGSITDRYWLNGASTVISDVVYPFISGGGLVGGTNGADNAKTEIVFAGGSVGSYWSNRGNTVTLAKATVMDGGTVGALYVGYSGMSVMDADYRVLSGGTVTTLRGGEGGINFLAGGTTSYLVSGGRVVGDLYLGNTAQSGAPMIKGSYLVTLDNATVGGIVYPNAGGTIETDGSFVYRITGSTIGKGIGFSGLGTSDMTKVEVGSLDLEASTSSLGLFNMSRVATTGAYRIVLDSVTISNPDLVFASQIDSGNSFGSFDVSAKNMTVGRTIYGIDCSSGISCSVNGDFSMKLDNVSAQGSISILNIASGAISGNMLVDFKGVTSPYSLYVLGSKTITVGGDLTINLNGVGISVLYLSSNGTIADQVTGSISVNVTGGTTSLNGIADAAGYFHIAEGATLVYGVNGKNQECFANLVNNGTLYYNTSIAQNTLICVASGITGSGTITSSTVGIHMVGQSAYAAAYQQTMMIKSDLTGSFGDAVTVDGINCIYGVTAFATDDDARGSEFYQEGTSTLVTVGGSISEETYGTNGKLGFCGSTVTKQAFAGALHESGTSIASNQNDLKIVAGNQAGSYDSLFAGEKVTGGTTTVTGDSTLTISGNGSVSAKAVMGGSYVGAKGGSGSTAALVVNASSSVTISTGTYSGFIAGGSLVNSGSSITGGTVGVTSTSLTITDGYFNRSVCGGNLSQGGSIKTKSSASVTISGGTVVGYVIGGNMTTKASYSLQTDTDIGGNTSVTIDTSTNQVAILRYVSSSGASQGHVVGGCYGEGQVGGSSTVTFKGYGSNLTIEGNITGDSSAGVDDIALKRFVTGTRSLVLDDFQGDLGSSTSKVIGFDRVELKNSTLDLKAYGQLKNVNEWSICDSTFNWEKGNNTFSQDKLSLSYSEVGDEALTVFHFDDKNLATGWDEFTSDVSNDSIATIKLSVGGSDYVTAVYDGGSQYLGTIGDVTYKFYYEYTDTTADLKLAKA